MDNMDHKLDHMDFMDHLDLIYICLDIYLILNVAAPIHQNPPSHIWFVLDHEHHTDLMDYVDEMDFSPPPPFNFPFFYFPTNLPILSPMPGIQMVDSSLLWMDIENIGCIARSYGLYRFVSFLFFPLHFFQFSPTPRRRSNEIKWWRPPPFKWILSRLRLLLTPGDGTYVPQHFHNPC